MKMQISDRPQRKSCLSHLLAMAMLFGLALWPALNANAGEPAYRDEVTTPHWTWEAHDAAGTVRALFLVDEFAAREPDELAQRFDFAATVIPVKGEAGRRSMDQAVVQAALRQPLDIVVCTCWEAWDALSAENRDALMDKVKAGMPLAYYRLSKKHSEGVTNALSDALPEAAPLVNPAGCLRALPIKSLSFRGELELHVYSLGRGRVIGVFGYNTHWTMPNAFLGCDEGHVHPPAAFLNDPITPELDYAIAARWLRWAAGKESDVRTGDAVLPAQPAAVGATVPIRIPLSGPMEAGDRVAWTLHSPFGEPLASGAADLSRGQQEVSCACPLRQGGRLLFRWIVQRGQTALDYGAAYVTAAPDAAFTALTCPDVIPSGGALPVEWTQTGNAAAGAQVLLQVYDPDQRLVGVQTAAAAAGRAEVAAWIPRAVSHTVRALLLQGGLVLDERRTTAQVRWDREDDLRRFNVDVWAMENGFFQDRNRYRVLRSLGITSTSPGGRNVAGAAGMASEEGLRLAPVNVLVPANRYKAAFDAAKEKEALSAYCKLLERYSPLGYMLCDEPGDNADHIAGLPPGEAGFRDWGAEIIRQQDPGARVGFSGVWMGFDRDPPTFFAHCDYVTAYSPHHLYTPNLWLGVERDLYRSFHQPKSLLTCWTHYCPWLDHEPSNRTVPWLWLFEGFNGVSYFSSGWEFAILPGDLRGTCETPWWSGELHEIERGIGEQIIAMKRENGAVRVLFSQGASGADIWARGCNEAHQPYRFISREELCQDIGADVKLLICPNVIELSAAEYAALGAFVSRGGTVVATAPLGAFEEGKGAPADRLEALFGVRRANVAGEKGAWTKSLARTADIPAKVRWAGDADWTLNGKDEIVGRTVGETGLVATDARVLASYKLLGEAKPDEINRPDFIRKLFATPAVLTKTCGKGRTLYFTLQPDLASTEVLLALLARQSGVPALSVNVATAAKQDDTVYLYPFSDGRIRLVGVIQDYWRVPPMQQVEGGKETALYSHHGPQEWTPQQAVLSIEAPAYLYDVRRGQYLGQVKQASFALQPGRPELFALLPYHPTKLTLSGPGSAPQGQTIEYAVALMSENGDPGSHVVHIALTDPAGQQTPADRYNVHTKSGRGSLRVQVPFNAAVGIWTVTARDAITGLSCQTTLDVAANGPAGPALASERVTVRRVPLDWPEGKWVPYTAGTDATRATAEVNVRARKPQWVVTADAELANAEITYGLKYVVRDDAKANHPGQPYAPGTDGNVSLGFNAPNPSSWFVNGYIGVDLDDLPATDYAMSEFVTVEDGANARVRATWDTPKGRVLLSFVLQPDHLAVFQELAVQPTVAINKVTVHMGGYPWGMGHGAEELFATVDPAKKAWVLLGNKTEDLAYGKGIGCSAIMVLPEELDSTPLLDKRAGQVILVHKGALAPGQEVKMHWALWMLPTLSNASAHDYMKDSTADARARLLRLFKMTQAAQ